MVKAVSTAAPTNTTHSSGKLLLLRKLWVTVLFEQYTLQQHPAFPVINLMHSTGHVSSAENSTKNKKLIFIVHIYTNKLVRKQTLLKTI